MLLLFDVGFQLVGLDLIVLKVYALLFKCPDLLVFLDILVSEVLKGKSQVSLGYHSSLDVDSKQLLVLVRHDINLLPGFFLLDLALLSTLGHDLLFL